MVSMGTAGRRRYGHRAALIARLFAVLVVSLGVLVLHVMTVENGDDRPATTSAASQLSVDPTHWPSITTTAAAVLEQAVPVVADQPAGPIGDHAWTSVSDCGLALLSAVAIALLATGLFLGPAWATGWFRAPFPGRLRPPAWPQLRLSLGVSQV